MLIIFVVVLSFLVNVETPITGMSVSDGASAEVDQEVVEAIKEEGKVSVIVELKDEDGNFFQKGQEADIKEVKSTLNELEFNDDHEFKNIGAFSGEITQSALI